MPYIITIVIYYLWLKQRRMLSRMDRLNDKVHNLSPKPTYHRLISILTEYGRLYHETQSYNHLISRHLTILVVAWITLISFYQLTLMTATHKNFRSIITFCEITMVTMVTTLTLGCAQISKIHLQLGMRMIRLYHRVSSNPQFKHIALLKVGLTSIFKLFQVLDI